MPSTSCCRSCPRCDDCPVLVAAAARARRERHDQQGLTVSALVDEVFAGVGLPGRSLPDSVTRTLDALDAARHRRGSAAVAS
ncbi:MAG: hypothetical protein JWR63_879 [Conexibacter sp.]|jgi:hypothetical protein|nr:hypothetical protein [Conexibacter sp.]